VGVGQTPVWGIAVAQNCRTEKSHPKQTQRVSAEIWGIVPRRIYGAAGRVIIQPMTRHKTAQTGLGTPQPRQLWLTAVLRALAMLVLHVASTLQMIRRRTAVIGTQPTPTDLPKAKTDTQSQEANAAQQSSPIALILRSAAKLRVSKDEGVLTTPSVSLGSRQAIHLPQCCALMEATQRSIATKGNCLHHSQSGGGGSPRLRGETEGARATRTAAPPPSGGGAKRTARASAKIRWGTALTHLTDSSASRQTVPHLGCARASISARQSSPARGRTKTAPINARANKNAAA
jgi:hypothetical protein